MAQRKKLTEEKSLPCGNLIIKFPVKFNFSSKLSLYSKYKEYCEKQGKNVNDVLNRWFFKTLFKVSDIHSWKSKNKLVAEKIDNVIKGTFRDELGLGIRDFSKEVNIKMKRDLHEK